MAQATDEKVWDLFKADWYPAGKHEIENLKYSAFFQIAKDNSATGGIKYTIHLNGHRAAITDLTVCGKGTITITDDTTEIFRVRFTDVFTIYNKRWVTPLNITGKKDLIIELAQGTGEESLSSLNVSGYIVH